MGRGDALGVPKPADPMELSFGGGRGQEKPRRPIPGVRQFEEHPVQSATSRTTGEESGLNLSESAPPSPLTCPSKAPPLPRQEEGSTTTETLDNKENLNTVPVPPPTVTTSTSVGSRTLAIAAPWVPSRKTAQLEVQGSSGSAAKVGLFPRHSRSQSWWHDADASVISSIHAHAPPSLPEHDTGYQA